MDQSSNISQNSAPKTNFWKELVQLVLLALLIVVPFRYFVAQPFIVDGLSMYPTFDNGEYLIIDELTYHFHTPERGSPIVFKYPKDPSKYFIKRVIGLPGEKVSIKDGAVTITNAENPDGLELDEPYIKLAKVETGEYLVGDKQYFVMGDNRLQSSDSRIWGVLPEENVVGRPFLRVFPPSLFPGQAVYESDINSNNP